MPPPFHLRPFDPEADAEALHAVFGDEESCRYLPEPATSSVEATRALLRRYTTGIEDSSWAVCDAPAGPALGRVALIPKEDGVFEAACMMTPGARGRGAAGWALARIIDAAFDHRRARRIWADIDPDNSPSLRVFTKLGFHREGRLRATWNTHIGVRDSIIMALIAGDPRPWPRGDGR